MKYPKTIAFIFGIIASGLSLYIFESLGNRFGNITPVIAVFPFLLAGGILGFLYPQQSWKLSLFLPALPGLIMATQLPSAIFFSIGWCPVRMSPAHFFSFPVSDF